jgi:hypothetical protein
MMRQLAIFCLAFSTGTVTLAQAAMEWRPNVAEDNKAATWEDTSAFMVSVLTTRGHNLLVSHDGSYIFGLKKDFSTSARCIMSYKQLSYPDGRTIAEAALVSVDFSKVDPLTIQVSFDSTRMLHWELHTWDVSSSGTNERSLSEWKGVKRDHTELADTKRGIKPEILEPSCGTDEKHCRAVSGSSNTDVQFFDDQEVAKRYARALMHAALICGGTKAVSPF